MFPNIIWSEFYCQTGKQPDDQTGPAGFGGRLTFPTCPEVDMGGLSYFPAVKKNRILLTLGGWINR